MISPWQWVREQTWEFDVSRTAWWGSGISILRSFFTTSLFRRSPMADTVVNYETARSLYRNDTAALRYGAGFVKPIIELRVEYMSLPTVSSEKGDNDSFLNECIRDYWAPQIQEIFRAAMRDSKTFFRYYQPRFDNPLFTAADKDHGCLEVVPPESVMAIVFDPVDKNMVLQVSMSHDIDIDTRTEQEVLEGFPPRMEKHQIIENITPDEYTYFDKTANVELTTWRTKNVWRFVPVWPAWNEYSADLGGGMSDIEPLMPFIQAIHDVIDQVLSAHKYHSIPKAKFNVKDVGRFIANNWPEVIEQSTGKIRQGAKIEWQGKEIIFFGPDEDGGFIEATSVLGDSTTLLDFLIGCICIIAETPRWALLIDDAAAHNNASVARFEKMIARKRISFTEPLVMMCKMALAANNKLADTPRLVWPLVSIEDLVSKGQALQQLIMAFDVAATHEWMADDTIRKILAATFPEMNAPEIEKALAAFNKIVEAAPAPASSTQALPPPKPALPPGKNGNGNGNGGGDKAAARKAVKQLASTTASRS